MLSSDHSELDAVRREWERATGHDRYHKLIVALTLCRGQLLPDWLHEAVLDVLWGRMPERFVHDMVRYWRVCEGRKKGLGNRSYAYASEQLAGTPAAGRASTMKRSYQKFARTVRAKNSG